MQVIKYVVYLRLCGGGCVSNILGIGPGFVSISSLNMMSFGTCGFVFVFLDFSVDLILIFCFLFYYYYRYIFFCGLGR